MSSTTGRRSVPARRRSLPLCRGDGERGWETEVRHGGRFKSSIARVPGRAAAAAAARTAAAAAAAAAGLVPAERGTRARGNVRSPPMEMPARAAAGAGRRRGRGRHVPARLASAAPPPAPRLSALGGGFDGSGSDGEGWAGVVAGGSTAERRAGTLAPERRPAASATLVLVRPPASPSGLSPDSAPPTPKPGLTAPDDSACWVGRPALSGPARPWSGDPLGRAGLAQGGSRDPGRTVQPRLLAV